MNFMQKCKRNGGFTLVELIVVIAILAILAGVAVPAYTGYIKKAESAADQQLLGAVNTAFAAACLEQGVDVSEVERVYTNKFEVNGEEKTLPANFIRSLTIDGSAVSVAKYEEAFDRYFAGNESSAFKVIENLFFTNGVFVDAAGKEVVLTYTDAATGKTYSYTADPNKAQALADSTFMNEMGIDTTLGIMDMVSNFASGFQGDSMQKVITGTDFMKSYVEYLGIDYEVTDSTDPDAFYAMLMNDHGVDQNMTANAIVLFAADKSSSLTTDSVKSLLGTEDVDAKTSILATLNSDPATAMAQTAAAYSMYTSFLYSQDDSYTNKDGKTKAELISEAKTNPISIMNGLNDDAFKSYINNSSDADINGYLSALDMLSGAAQTGNGANGTVANDILNEGFNTNWMNGILGQVTGN